MILREASFPVGPMVVCKWPIFTVRVITLKNKMSVDLRRRSCVLDSFM